MLNKCTYEISKIYKQLNTYEEHAMVLWMVVRVKAVHGILDHEKGVPVRGEPVLTLAQADFIITIHTYRKRKRRNKEEKKKQSKSMTINQ